MTPPRTHRAPGWYQDPDDPTRVRHWAGRTWSGRERPRPAWHLVAEDIAPDPCWANPGGVTRSLRDRPPLGWPAGDQVHRHPPPEDPANHPLTNPELGDRPAPGHLLEGPTLDRRRPVDRHRRGSGRHDPLRSAAISARAAAAAFGVEPMGMGYGLRMRGPGARGPLPPPAWPGSHGVGGRSRASWRQNRASLAMFVGILLLGMLALFISVGADGPNHLSAVALDAAFVRPANAACAAALANPSAPLTAGRRSAKPSPSPAAGHGESSNAHRPAPGAVASSHPRRPAAVPAATISTLADRLRQLPLTAAATPQVAAWLTQWQRYLQDEHAAARARVVHDTSAADAATRAAHAEATDADAFALGNGLSACALDPSDEPSLELIP